MSSRQCIQFNLLISNWYNHVLAHVQAEAEATHESVETILTNALSTLYPPVSVDPRRAQMMEKGAAFNALHPELVKRYLGRFVAVKGGAVVDDDTDLETLALRTRARFPNEVVYIDEVQPMLPQPLRMRSPRFAKGD